MSWWVPRAAFAFLMVITLAMFFVLLQAVNITQIIIGHQPAAVPELRADRPLQSIYALEAEAARSGWTPESRRQVGYYWYSLGDLSRAVANWESATPDARVLRDLSQAYIDLQRWADADASLERMLPLLPPGAPDRAWAHFQLGMIRAAYDPQGAAQLLRIAEPTYGASVMTLIPILESDPDSLRVGLALADSELWAYAELAFSSSADPLANAYAGLVRDMQGKDGSAQIQTALALLPQSAQAHFIHGLHLRLKFDFDASLEAITQAVALDPENPALYAELGRAYQLLGDFASAERWLKFAVSLDSSFQAMLDSFYADEEAILRDMGLMDEAVLPFDTPLLPEQ